MKRAINLMKLCLHKNPKERPNFSYIRNELDLIKIDFY